jgi:NifB/MoaA-like Fe-S oxidoreductase
MKFLDQLQNPPREFTAIPFWFLNGDLTAEELRRQLADFAAHGIYGVVLHPRMGLSPDITYLGERYFAHIRTAVEAAATLDILDEFAQKCRAEYGRSVIYPSDEWYLTAERPLPPAEFYDAFAQLEDGVGMWRLYHDTFLEELENYTGLVLPHSMDVVTGTLAGPLIRECADALMQKYPQVKITVHEIKNEYFGGNVSVAGLVTGTDIIKQCSGKLHSDLLAVPEVMIRDEKGQFLDDITLEELGRALGCRAVSIPTDGGGCCKAMLSTHKRKTIKFKR